MILQKLHQINEAFGFGGLGAWRMRQLDWWEIMCSSCPTHKTQIPSIDCSEILLQKEYNEYFLSCKKGTIDTSTANDFDSILMILTQFTSTSLSSGGKSGPDLTSRLRVLEATWIFFWHTSLVRCLSSGGNKTMI